MPDKKRVLFVDDEPRILDGLRRTLRPMRREWRMSFARSGQEALDILAGESFDIIVADMRMPGMDGAQLLSQVRTRYPQTVRIALSGTADKEPIFCALGAIHQYRSKPCNAETLKSTLARAGSLRDMLADEKLRQLVSQMETLPSLPCLYDDLVKELQSSEPSITAVGQIVSRDMGMSTKILQLAHSTLFGIRRRVSSPAQAVGLLGLDTVKTLVLSAQVFSQFDQAILENLSLNSLWDHSVAVGTFARRVAVAENAGQKTADYALTAGLLHDVGKLVLAANLPKEYSAALALAARKGIRLVEAEREMFGATHAKVGAYLLGLWGLPEPIVAATAFHHSPTIDQAKQFSPLTAMHVANFLEHKANSTNEMDTRSQLHAAYLAKLGLAERIPVWQEICQETIQ
jgi:HD-like signal output (HDOD) protein